MKEYAFIDPEHMGGTAAYIAYCDSIGLPPDPEGYGVLLCEDADGQRFTVVCDIEYVRTLVVGNAAGVLGGLQVPGGVVWKERSGWPDEW